MAKLIFGFYGVGLRTLVKKLKAEGLPVIRLCGQTPQQVKELIAQGTYVFARADVDVMRIYDRWDIPYALVYPALNCQSEYVSRWVRSGRKLTEVSDLKLRWVGKVAELSAIKAEKVICLGQGKYLPRLDDPIWTDRPFVKGNS